MAQPRTYVFAAVALAFAAAALVFLVLTVLPTPPKGWHAVSCITNGRTVVCPGGSYGRR